MRSRTESTGLDDDVRAVRSPMPHMAHMLRYGSNVAADSRGKGAARGNREAPVSRKLAMIPEKLVDFLHGPHVMLLGTRSGKLRPSVARILGAKADAKNDHITIFLPDLAGLRVLHDLEDNGMVALTVCDAISHEAYQFKGTFVDAQPSDDQSMAVQYIYKSKMIVHHRQIGSCLSLTVIRQ